MTTYTDDAVRRSLLGAAHELRSTIRAQAETIDLDRSVPASIVEPMNRSGIFRSAVPSAIGGLQVDPFTRMEVVEAYAEANGSVGWIAGVVSGGAACTAYLAPEVGRQIYGDHVETLVAGNLAMPTGAAVAVDGGYRLSGRWSYGSGSEHAQWFVSNSTIHDGDTPRTRPDGTNVTRWMVFPADGVEIIDTWKTTGLRGTGSNDYTCHDVFVPEERTFHFAEGSPYDAPHYRARFFLLDHGAHALGLARAAIDTFKELAASKNQLRSSSKVRDRQLARIQTAQAEGLYQSARSFLWAATERAWKTAHQVDGLVPLEQWGLVRLAMTEAVQKSAEAVRLVYDAGGGTSVLESSPISYAWRDVHVATQHAMVATFSYDLYGHVALFGDEVPTDIENRLR